MEKQKKYLIPDINYWVITYNHLKNSKKIYKDRISLKQKVVDLRKEHKKLTIKEFEESIQIIKINQNICVRHHLFLDLYDNHS